MTTDREHLDKAQDELNHLRTQIAALELDLDAARRDRDNAASELAEARKAAASSQEKARQQANLAGKACETTRSEARKRGEAESATVGMRIQRDTALRERDQALAERDELHDRLAGCSQCAMKACMLEGTEHFYVGHSVAFSMCPRHAAAFKARWLVRSGPEHCALVEAQEKAEHERDQALLKIEAMSGGAKVVGRAELNAMVNQTTRDVQVTTQALRDISAHIGNPIMDGDLLIPQHVVNAVQSLAQRQRELEREHDDVRQQTLNLIQAQLNDVAAPSSFSIPRKHLNDLAVCRRIRGLAGERDALASKLAAATDPELEGFIHVRPRPKVRIPATPPPSAAADMAEIYAGRAYKAEADLAQAHKERDNRQDAVALLRAELQAARRAMRDARQRAQDAQGRRDVDTAVWGEFADELAFLVGIDVEELKTWGDTDACQKRGRLHRRVRDLRETAEKADQLPALRARLFPSATLEQSYIVTCPGCDRKLVTRWIDTGPVGGVDVAGCPCGYRILSESEGNPQKIADLLAAPKKEGA